MEFNFNMYSKAEYDHFNLAHLVWKTNIKKKKLKQTNTGPHLVQYKFKISEGSLEGTRKTMDLWNRLVFSLEWKAEGVR